MLKGINKTGIRNKQMLLSAMNMCIIQLFGYSVEEAYCRLEFDFARVGSSRSDRKELPADEEFHIRRGSFSYGKEKTADVDGTGIVQLIGMFSFPITLSHNSVKQVQMKNSDVCHNSHRFSIAWKTCRGSWSKTGPKKRGRAGPVRRGCRCCPP